MGDPLEPPSHAAVGGLATFGPEVNFEWANIIRLLSAGVVVGAPACIGRPPAASRSPQTSEKVKNL